MRVSLRLNIIFFLLVCIAPAGLLRAEIGNELWSFQTGDAVFASPTLDSEGNIYFGSIDGSVYSLDSSGGLRWSTPTGDWIQSSAALSPDESVVYLGSWDNSLYALDAQTGQTLWKYATANLVYSSPAVAQDGTIYFGSSDGFIYAVDPAGQLEWEAFVGGELDSSVAIGANGNLYFASTEGSVYCYNPEGLEQWVFDVPDEIGALDREKIISASCALSGQGAVYIGCENYFFYALDESDGSLLWKFETGAEIDASATISIDGNILVSSRDGYIYSLDASGNQVWRTQIGENYFSSAVVDELGRIYVSSNISDTLSYLNLLSPDGTLLQQIPFAEIVDSSVALGSEGALYFGSYDGKLYAFDNGARLSNSVWPKFRRNLASQGTMEGFVPPIAGREEFFNIAMRGSPLGGENDVFAGFVVEGPGEKKLLVRGVGSGLASQNIEDFLENPKVEYFGPNGAGKFAENVEWGLSASASALADEMERVGAFALEEGSSDSAELLSLGAGLYTARMSNAGGEDGVALFEVYDADEEGSDASLINISMRGRSGQGQEVLIAGFVISGNLPKRVLIRAIGPGTGDKGVNDFLVDPTLRLFRGQNVLDSNDDWGDHPERTALEAYMNSAGAFALEEGSKDSALFTWLEPGLYTAIVRGNDSGTGIALVEIYDLTGL